ncbi:sphingosine kinase 2-like isoform X2 [Belonocnema kinseyi]|uniref:sphingosine kinase 2-like isoform X2 n=1 Tax=Belonocnema kinseyi TaxID=2817044 RepID=UPI00143DCBD9|nr:sphingosine kinase 2-like isoform X2 [Belonocnema kinseyi]
MGEETQARVTSVLEETFYITSKKNTIYRVKLTDKGLSLQKESNGTTKTETIPLIDIIGCRCMRSKRQSAGSCVCRPGAFKSQLRVVESTEVIHSLDEYDTSAYLYIYAYTLKKARVKGARRRERTTITLRFRSFDRYEDNLREASRWRLAIKCLVSRVPVPKTLMSPSHGNLESIISACPGEQRKILVLLNPKSGPGRGRETFQRRIHPILSEAEKPYEIHITRYSNYARDFVRTKDIYQWSGLLMVGGDGIVFEVVNGIFQRPDWERAIKELPIGVIPCGSGNGLAKSIAYARQEPYNHNPMMISALSVVKSRKAALDLVRVETRNHIFFSFLSVAWGLLADIDIESETLRAIGGQRFTVWSLARLIGLRTYKGKVSYLPYDKVPVVENLNNDSIYRKDQTKDAKIPHSKSFGDELDRFNGIRGSKSYHDTLEANTNGLIDVLNHCNEETENSSDDNIMYGPPSTLPALTAPVPNNWTQIEGEFVMVNAAYLSHLAQDIFFAPHSRLADGIIWLLIIKAGISRSHLLQFLLGLSTGSHLTVPGVEMIPVKAFRIEPAEGTSGYLVVDGENVDYGPIQAEMFPSLATVMCP